MPRIHTSKLDPNTGKWVKDKKGNLERLSVSDLKKKVRTKQKSLCPAYSKMTKDQLITYLMKHETDNTDFMKARKGLQSMVKKQKSKSKSKDWESLSSIKSKSRKITSSDIRHASKLKKFGP